MVSKIKVDEIESFNVVKGFLNLKLSHAFWLNYFNEKININN